MTNEEEAWVTFACMDFNEIVKRYGMKVVLSYLDPEVVDILERHFNQSTSQSRGVVCAVLKPVC